MNTSEIIIAGDTAGIEWRLPVLRFKGSDPKAPKVYIQAALHANELPGTALVHFLCERLRQSENAGQIKSDFIVVPHANPIGAAWTAWAEMTTTSPLAPTATPRLAKNARRRSTARLTRFCAVSSRTPMAAPTARKSWSW